LTKFSAVYFAGLNASFGVEPRISKERLDVPAVKFCLILQKIDHPK